MSKHISVLLNESIEMLNIKPDGIYVDATLGGGGHSSEILKRLTTGHLYCFDQDDYAIDKAKERLSAISSNFTIIKSNFRNLKNELEKFSINKIDGIIYDLGVSSFQFDIPSRGFSYRFDAYLDMRMDTTQDLTCYEIVNTYDFKQLEQIFYRYSEEPFSSKIASRICSYRETKAIETTFELVDIIKSCLPNKILNQKGHPAKRVFQALRIAVNDELKVFEYSLKDAIDMLNVEGRAAVITFHSLEDRICKTLFKEYSTIDLPKGLPIVITQKAPLEIITRKPLLPSEEELSENNRAHSAKLRVARKQI